MVAAPSLGLPRRRTFQSQPGLARRLEQHGKFLVGVPELAWERQSPAAVEVSFLLTRRALLREAEAFCGLRCFLFFRRVFGFCSFSGLSRGFFRAGFLLRRFRFGCGRMAPF